MAVLKAARLDKSRGRTSPEEDKSRGRTVYHMCPFLRLANNSIYGLTASVYTGDVSKAGRVAAKIRAPGQLAK